jgi:hypothetical protein
VRPYDRVPLLQRGIWEAGPHTEDLLRGDLTYRRKRKKERTYKGWNMRRIDVSFIAYLGLPQWLTQHASNRPSHLAQFMFDWL